MHTYNSNVIPSISCIIVEVPYDYSWDNLNNRLNNNIMIFADSRVGFTAYLSMPLYKHRDKVVIYDVTVTNEGAAYNATSGVFTAPQNATYLFTWNSMTRHLDWEYESYVFLYLYKNGDQLNFVAFSYDRRDSSLPNSSSNSAVLSLSEGDTVWVQTQACDVLYSGPFTSFSGFKVWWVQYVRLVN